MCVCVCVCVYACMHMCVCVAIFNFPQIFRLFEEWGRRGKLVAVKSLVNWGGENNFFPHF